MDRWQFRAYRSVAGDVVRDWYDLQIMEVRAEFLTITRYLRDLHADHWEGPDYKTLKGKLGELGEIRVIIVSEHHRILGFREDGIRSFTMLTADKKTKRYNYKVVGGVALTRKSEVLSNRDKFSQNVDWIDNECDEIFGKKV